MENSIKQKSLFFPNLDGLRFLAFFYVFLFHCSFLLPTGKKIPFFTDIFIFLAQNGALGVNFFFVLSGFLISLLLLREEQLSGKIHLTRFYIRRILRIWPLYYLTLFLGFVVYPFVAASSGNPVRETASPLAYLFFMGNFNILATGPPYSGALRVLWSVAVEEQFYLVWPLLLIAITRRRIWIFLVITIGSLIFRGVHADDAFLLTYHPFSLAGDFAVGGLLAWVILRIPRPVQAGFRHYKKVGILIYGMLAMFLLFQDRIFISPGLIIFQRLIMSLLFAFVIFDQTYCEQALFEMRRNRLLSAWGKYSYGLYCFHVPILALILKIFKWSEWPLPVCSVLTPVTAFAITLACGYLSFRFFETPFLRLKSRFRVIPDTKKNPPGEPGGTKQLKTNCH